MSGAGRRAHRARGITATVSASTVRRWLREDAIKPCQYQSWIFITDPDFRPKAQRVLDLYARTFEGELLGADEYLISADEKTSVQARCRCHPTLAPGQARMMRVNHTYKRGGALAYLAAYDVHAAKVFGRTEERTGIVPFMNLVSQVMSQEPYASAKRVFWVVDKRLLAPGEEGRRPADRGVSERCARAHPRPRLLVEPSGDLLLRRAAQGRDAQRLHRPEAGRGPAPSLRRPLQRHGTAVPVEVHHFRPGRSAGQARRAHRRSPRRILCRPHHLIHPRRTYGADH